MLGPANFQIFSRIRDLEAKAFGSAVATVGAGLVSVVSGNRSKLISMRAQDRTSQKADAPSLYATEVVAEAPATTPVPAPNMDDLVAKVLARMSPEVLQAVTREILKPVVEAMVKEELKLKKS